MILHYRFIRALLVVVVSASIAPAQQFDPWADSVAVFEPGEGQTSGQDPQYFPDNVLGPPDTAATDSFPSTGPEEILSIGLGGRIVLAFTDNLILDGPGPDFTVFENAFIRQFGPAAGLPFAEPARVAVSRDGINFFSFPFDSLTLQGLAGVTPTRGHANPTDPQQSGGDSFDLADIGLDSIRYVELIDVTAIVKDNREHLFWDPTLSGFDLDAVVAINTEQLSTAVNDAEMPQAIPTSFSNLLVFPNPFDAKRYQGIQLRWQQSSAAPVELIVMNVLGQRVAQHNIAGSPGERSHVISLAQLANGQYFIRMRIANHTETQRFTVVH